MVRALLLIIGILALNFSLYGQGQTRTTKKISKNFYGNGQVKSVSETWTTLPKYIDPMNFYKKTKVFVTEFDSLTHRKVKEWTRVFKIGKDGKPCHEIFYEEITYDAFGNRVTYMKSRCDKRKSKYKQYKNGKVDFVQVVKHRKRQ
jgi:hypothetical protein